MEKASEYTVLKRTLHSCLLQRAKHEMHCKREKLCILHDTPFLQNRNDLPDVGSGAGLEGVFRPPLKELMRSIIK